MTNNKIIIIYQKVGKPPELKKINNNIVQFEELVGREI
jgi:hypothetical protein